LSDVKSRYGAPYYLMHRADVHKAFLDTAIKKGVHVRCNARVVEFDYDGGRVKTDEGTWYSGDLIVAADGLPRHRIR
jgi:salicylate hydroxylase